MTNVISHEGVIRIKKGKAFCVFIMAPYVYGKCLTNVSYYNNKYNFVS